jgi:chaperonin GroES
MKLNFLLCFMNGGANLIINLKIFQFQSRRHSIYCTFAVPQNSEGNHFNKTQINTTMAKKLSVTPLHDRVIVKPAPAEEKTAGGIIIPDTAKEKPQRGVVIAAGPGKKDEPMSVKSGDTVLYGKYAGTEIQIEGDDLLIMRESDILAIV